MSINETLLVAAPVLQDYFVDKSSGDPLNGGLIYCFVDNDRTTYKNWYYQTGTPGNYSYSPLDNPLTLSAVGTIQNPSGSDVIPYFYPYDETNNVTKQAYYIIVKDSDGTTQFTRADFPFIPEESTPTEGISTNKNYIVNNVFWRNGGTGSPSTITASGSALGSSFTYNVGATLNAYSLLVAPSQHDGYPTNLSDIRYITDQTDGTQVITFTAFVGNEDDQVLDDDVTPEFYMNFHCSSAGTATIKAISIPLSLHIASLSAANGTFTIQAVNESGAANNEIVISVVQYLGTGSATASSSDDLVTLTLSNTWTKYEVNVPLPTADNITTSGTGDDALFMYIYYPVGVADVNISIAVPSFYLADEAPTNNFQTYDEVNSIISTPRTGDIRMSLNSYNPYGWVGCNDGTIGSGSSNATTRANIDTFPLYSLIWNSVGVTYAPIYTSAGANSTYGSSAAADFTANKQLALTKFLGKVLAGIAPNIPASETVTFTNATDVCNVADAMKYPTGTPIVFTNSGGAVPAELTAGIIYYSISVAATTIKMAASIANALAGTAIDITDDGTGTTTLYAVANYIDATHINKLAYPKGEVTHTLISSELPDPITEHAGNIAGGIGVQSAIENSSTPGSGVIANDGGNQPHNIMQPTVFTNVFLKL